MVSWMGAEQREGGVSGRGFSTGKDWNEENDNGSHTKLRGASDFVRHIVRVNTRYRKSCRVATARSLSLTLVSVYATIARHGG
jgi:hypothetical protein